MWKKLLITTFLAGSAAPASAQVAEICGNGIDDDDDGFADEGCYPGLTNPLVDNPLSTRDTGLVSPSTGSLYYPVTPDVHVKTPFGGDLVFRRTYASMINPGSSPPAYKKPLGDRWTHNYMGWITHNGSTIIARLPTGQDIVAQHVSGCNYQTRGGQATKGLVHCSGSGVYRIDMLDGGKLEYVQRPFNGPVVLREIWPANAIGFVGITYGANDQVDAVVDATVNRMLVFGYTNNLLTSVQLQVNGTTQHTTSYSYTGNNLTSVTIGGQLAQTNTYSNNYLTQIQDGAGKSIVSFAYDSATAGKVARVDSQRGMVGFELASSRTGCSGSNKTVVYFNRGNTSSCSVDGDCGTGFLCGGKTGAGATGQCFRAARCLTVDKSAGIHEELVTSVSAIGPPNESCEGACTDVAQYLWSNSTAFVASLGVQDPSGNYTLREINSHGLPTHITFGDPDSNPTNGNAAREVWLKYDNANLPGLVTEIRRKSELHAQASSCSPSVGDPCKITSIQYATSGKPSVITESGWTLNSSGSVVAYSYTTTMSYDTRARITQIDGPLAGSSDLTTFTYFPLFTDPLTDGYLQKITRHIDGSGRSLSTVALAYDAWGHPTALRGMDYTSPAGATTNGTLTCLTFSAARGHLTQRREAMAGQTSCASSNSADLVTSFTRDSALRLTQVTRPDGSCAIFEYDSKGRLQRNKRRDDCNAASSGDRQELIYDAEGLVTEVQTYDASGTLTAKQPYTYADSRRLLDIVNPVDTSKMTSIGYDARGLVAEVKTSDGLGFTRYNRDPNTPEGRDGRVTSVDKYKTGSTFDTWTLLFDWIGNQFKVTDGDSKTTATVRDDMGRVVELTSPDLSGTTLRIYDNASRLVTEIEAFGTGSARQHSFTYDFLGRMLSANYAGVCPTGTPQPEIQRVFDVPPTTCPISGSCVRTAGRLAYAKVSLLCTSAQSSTDGSLDQETFYSFDDAGRLIREYVRDDVPAPNQRIADHQYEWTKNGALSKVTLPSSTVLGWSFGTTGSNSDTDRVSAVWRTNTSTPIVDAIQWFPFGGVKQYNQMNSIGNKVQRVAIDRNLAYRITKIALENQSNGADNWSIVIGEDAKGRVTKRDYTGAATGVQDSFFLYDSQDRVLCETTSLVSTCPTSGSTLKNNHPDAFTNAGDWKRLLRPIPGSTGFTHQFNPSGYGSSHQVTMIRQNDGSPALGDTSLAYDAFGQRIWDDNTSTLTNDRRDYTFDARGNLINVHGKYYSGGTWRDYDVTSAFDAQNRRVFKSFLDNSTNVEAQWFFYYDAFNRLTEVRHTPNTGSPSTYTLFQMSWLGNRLVHYWQTDYPSVTTSRRYVSTDESGRPIDMWSWPTSGNASRVWAINPSAWGFDTNVVGASVFQPVLFAGQYADHETAAMQNNGTTVHRPGLVANGFRTYDPLTGGLLDVNVVDGNNYSAWDGGSYDPKGETVIIEDTGPVEPTVDIDGCRDLGFCGDSGGQGWGSGGGFGGGGGGGGGGRPVTPLWPCDPPDDIEPPWLQTGDLLCFFTGPTTGGTIHPLMSGAKWGVFKHLPNLIANPRICVPAEQSDCLVCLTECQLTYTDGVKECRDPRRVESCEQCQQRWRQGRDQCIQACRSMFCKGQLSGQVGDGLRM